MIYVKIPFTNQYKLPDTCVDCKFREYDDKIVWRNHGKTELGGYVCVFSRQLINNTEREEFCPVEDDGIPYK